MGVNKMKSKRSQFLLACATCATVLCFISNHFVDAQYQSHYRPPVRGGGSQTCLNPDNKYGMCVPLTKCQPLYKILMERPINRESVVFLQRATCGFSGEEPDVCCLIQDLEKVEVTTMAPTPTPKPNNGRKTTPYPEQNRPRPSPRPSARPATQRPAVTTIPTTARTTMPTTTPTIQPTTMATTTRSIHASVASLDSSQEIRTQVSTHRNLRLLPTLRTCGKVLTLNNIIGGHEAGLGTYPWMVLLAFTDADDSDGSVQYACGGSLISRNYVLTAAHCVAKLPTGFRLSSVRIGEYDQREEEDCSDGLCAPPVQDIGIQEIIYHENYDKKLKKENDIALLRLNRSVEFGTFVAPICLPLPRDDVFTKSSNMTKLTVAGWGRTDFQSDDSASVLQEVNVPIITKEECNRFYKADKLLGEIDEGRFCSGGEAGKDSCKGDSGGPIMGGILMKSLNGPQYPITRIFQFGIVSVGPSRCGSEGQPALYTKVSHFLPWILDHLKS